MIRTSEGSTLISQLRGLPATISATQLVIASILIISTLWVMLDLQQQQAREQQETLNRNYGQLIVTRLHEVTAQISALVISIASLGEANSHQPEQLQRIIPIMLDLESQKSLISGGGLWPEPDVFHHGKNKDSLFWARTPQGTLQQLDNYNQSDAPAYRDQYWYRPARLLPRGKVLWSKSYRDPFTHESMITASAPLWLQHRYIGSATVDISLKQLNSFIHSGNEKQRGYIMVVDQFGQLLSAPTALERRLGGTLTLMNIRHLSHEIPDFSPLTSALQQSNQTLIELAAQQDRYQHEQIAPILAPLPANEAQLTRATLSHLATGWPSAPYPLANINLANDPILHEQSMVSVFLMPDTYWKVIVATPYSTFGAGVKSLVGKIGAYLVVIQLLALALLFYILHRFLIKPLSTMVMALQHNQPEQIEILASERHDELATLARAFISRNRQLETTMASLDATNLALEQQLAVQADAQLSLSQYRDQLTALIESSDNLIFIKDPQGKYLLVNEKFCQLLGRERQRIIGMNDTQLFPPEQAEKYRERDLRTLRSDSTISFNTIFHGHQGSRALRITKFVIRNSQDQILGIGAIAFDIAHQNREVEQLKQQLQQQSDENAVLSHSLDNISAQLEAAKFTLKQHNAQPGQHVNQKVIDFSNQVQRQLLQGILHYLLQLQNHTLASSDSVITAGVTMDSITKTNNKHQDTETIRHLTRILDPANGASFSQQDMLSLLNAISSRRQIAISWQVKAIADLPSKRSLQHNAFFPQQSWALLQLLFQLGAVIAEQHQETNGKHINSQISGDKTPSNIQSVNQASSEQILPLTLTMHHAKSALVLTGLRHNVDTDNPQWQSLYHWSNHYLQFQLVINKDDLSIDIQSTLISA